MTRHDSATRKPLRRALMLSTSNAAEGQPIRGLLVSRHRDSRGPGLRGPASGGKRSGGGHWPQDSSCYTGRVSEIHRPTVTLRELAAEASWDSYAAGATADAAQQRQ